MSAMLKRRALKRVTKFFKQNALTPEGAITAPIGALCISTEGGADLTLYTKEADDGDNTGWEVVPTT